MDVQSCIDFADPRKREREESGHFGHGSEAKLPYKPGFPLIIAPH